ncbi:Mth938-like domain-containing protein [Zavarzinia sp.]|uniref:Mth938-like domain-containing protein n=1 Tax=Zavarzinia sp. TaxID=2027920 RepID=UPI00356893B2
MALRELDQAVRRIEKYGDGGFRIEGVAYAGGLLLTPKALIAWPVADLGQVTVEPLLAVRDDFEFLLIGSGKTFALPPKPVREALKAAGLRFDVMDTGAACRTYNVLAAEGRLVAAALVPVA